MTSSRINLQLGEPIIVGGQTHGVRVFTTDDTLNNAVPNGGLLKFDTIGLRYERVCADRRRRSIRSRSLLAWTASTF